MSEPLVTIITVNYNQIEATCALLDSIRLQQYRQIEVIVVDNGSSEDPREVITQQYPEVQYIRSATNLGFAKGNNLGLRQAKGAFLFFVNNDTELTPNCIGELVVFCQKTPQVGIVSPLICYYQTDNSQPDLIQYAGMTRVSDYTGRNRILGEKELDNGQFKHAVPTAYAHGAAMMMPRKAMDQVGPMPEDFFLYYEELDWCERIRRAKLGVWIYPNVRIYHKESLTVGKIGALKTYFHTRNRLLFMRRNRNSTLIWFSLYFLGIVLPKSALQYIVQGDWANLRAFLQAIGWHYLGIKNSWEHIVNTN